MDALVTDILKAAIYDLVKRTPLTEVCPRYAGANQIWLKREDHQAVFSFKLRGAYNCILNLPEAIRKRGVICASAGNHGQGVAIAAQKLGIPATIVMPETAPSIKVEAVRRFGAEVVLHGDSYSDAQKHCDQLVAQCGLNPIHPFDDPQVIAGQGTVGKEIFEQCPQAQRIYVPVGGGGLLAGIAAYIKQVAPHIKVVGVEPEDSAAMTASLAAANRVELTKVGLFCDGVAVKRVGEHTFRVAQRYVDEMITVSTDDVAAAVAEIYGCTRTITEPSGALAYAGLKADVRRSGISGENLIAITSGANMNFQRLAFVAERALTGGQGREALYAIKLSEQAGTLKNLHASCLYDLAITEFNYRKSSGDAFIFVGIGLNPQHSREVIEKRLGLAGYSFCDLTRNDLAKNHLRHMVGGRSAAANDEELVRFSFPERKGALGEFLQLLSDRWNISLFHYRCHGADFGRVLMGFEVNRSQSDLAQFKKFLASCPWDHQVETGNPAVKLFLQEPGTHHTLSEYGSSLS